MNKLFRPAVGVVAALAMCAALSPSFTRATFAGDKPLNRAERALRSGEFESAEKICREVLAKEPKNVAARLGLSHALLKQRKHRDAFDHAARVIAIDPTSARAHSLLGAALLGSGSFRLSVEEFRTALSFKDDDAMAIAGLAMVDFYENRLRASLEGLRRAAFLQSDEPDYVFNLGQVAARSERYAEAANAYEQFLRVAPRTDTDRRERIRGLIDFLRYLGAQKNLVTIGGPSRDTIPFELVNNRPVITVRVNGSKETLRFVLDSGAGMCVIAEATANRLGLKPVARGGLARAIGGGGRFDIVYGFLQSMQLGDTRVENVPVYIRQFFNQTEQVDGYIGLSILSKFLSVVDYGERVMTLQRRGEARPLNVSGDSVAAPPAPFIEIPIRTTSSGFWSGEVRIEGLDTPVNFIIDTGATISVVSEALAVRESMDRFARGERIRVYGAAGLAENIQTLLLPRMHLGAHARQNVHAAVINMDAINETAGFEQTGIVGGNVLRNFRVTFDFDRAVVRLEPLAGAASPDGTKGQTPVITSQS
jgi:predicted aspartyl protease/Tfp pilus assembly protein PilF